MHSNWLVVGGGLLVLVLSSMPRSAQPCSVAFDETGGPETVLAYEASLAPEAPEISRAFIYESADDGGSSSCGGTSGCGPLRSLRVELAELPEVYRVQVVYPDGKTTFAAPADPSSLEMFLPWQSFYDVPAEMTVRVVDDEGNPSQDVTLTIDFDDL